MNIISNMIFMIHKTRQFDLLAGVQRCSGSYANRKSPGCDNLPIELIIEAGEMTLKWLFNKTNKVWVDSKIEDDWGKIIILHSIKIKEIRTNAQTIED